MDFGARRKSLLEFAEDRPLAEHTRTTSATEYSRRLRRLVTVGPEDLMNRGKTPSIILRVLNSPRTTFLMSLLTLYALFADDFRLATTSHSADDYFFAGAAICFLLFLVEIGFNYWIKVPYRGSFYFWLDVVSTISIIPDIGWLWGEMVGSSDAGNGSQVNQVQNVGKTSRVGARTSRIIRIVRLIRLIRLLKLYKSTQAAIEAASISSVLPEEEFVIPHESKIGKKLSDLTTKRVIILVLVVLILLPLFELQFFLTSYTSWEFGTNSLDAMMGSSGFGIAMETFIGYHQQDIRPLIFYSVGRQDLTVIWRAGIDLNQLRLEEKFYIASGSQVAIFDIRYDTQLDAILSIVRTVFTCVVLAVASFYLTKDANEIVIAPIEKMIEKVKKIARNPVGILDMNMMEMYDLDEEEEAVKWWEKLCCKKATFTPELETRALDTAIQKIATLLAISFGEAGARIIAENVARGDSINPLLEGKKVLAIFGFCDIRNFTDTTEVLQESIMTFVNEIAEVVHHTVDHHMGVANKNIGDAFLVVWKFRDALYKSYGGNLTLPDESPEVNSLADLSIISFVKVLSKINMQINILRYKEHPDLRKRMPGYSVKMGFSLHMGWAIEGAIGSELKVDASYLSPHVNLSMQLEELTKYYNKSLLFTGSLFNICSEYMKEKCRHIDTLRSESGVVLRLYTFDLDLTSLSPIRKRLGGKERFTRRKKRLSQIIKGGDGTASSYFETSKYLQHLTQGVSPQYIALFNQATTEFEIGDWEKCRNTLKKCQEWQPTDRPTIILLNILEANNYSPPLGWSGSHPFPGK